MRDFFVGLKYISLAAFAQHPEVVTLKVARDQRADCAGRILLGVWSDIITGYSGRVGYADQRDRFQRPNHSSNGSIKGPPVRPLKAIP